LVKELFFIISAIDRCGSSLFQHDFFPFPGAAAPAQPNCN